MADRSFVSPLSHLDPAHLLDALPASILVLDAELCLVFANAEAQTLLGISFARVRGRPVAELLREPRAVTEALRAALTQQGAVSVPDVALKITPLAGSASAECVHLQASAFDDEMTGAHLVLRLARAGRVPVPRRPRPHRKPSPPVVAAPSMLSAPHLQPAERAGETLDSTL